MSKAADFRNQAREAEQRAEQSTSVMIATLQRRRAESFHALADNEDWLNGETTEKAKARSFAAR